MDFLATIAVFCTSLSRATTPDTLIKNLRTVEIARDEINVAGTDLTIPNTMACVEHRPLSMVRDLLRLESTHTCGVDRARMPSLRLAASIASENARNKLLLARGVSHAIGRSWRL